MKELLIGHCGQYETLTAETRFGIQSRPALRFRIRHNLKSNHDGFQIESK